jgi:mRNA interferase RelE/StbE
MAVKFRKQAIKFLEKSNPQEIENIRSSIQLVTLAVEEQGIIPFTELDIKKNEG